MIRRIEALNYRCLRYVQQDLKDFHVLVGPNASGKTTFLDVVAFMGNLVSGGLEFAISERTNNYADLFWKQQGTRFELAIELQIPEQRRRLIADPAREVVRYEVAVGADEHRELALLSEKVILRKATRLGNHQRQLFPMATQPPETILTSKSARDSKTVVNKVPGGNDNFYDETGKGWDHAFKLGPRRSALGNLPEDESKFPVATWLKALLAEGVQQLVLNSLAMRSASPPGQTRRFKPDGSNLPWVVDSLINKHPDRHRLWLEHLRAALPDLRDVRTREREDDKHSYLVLEYEHGLHVPSWMASDGTLRLLALTVPAYLPEFEGIYLIEEPENGIHPRAVETMFQSLSSVYGAQILLATHSQVILSVAEVDTVLCFAKTPEGITDIVLGSEHPALKQWKGEENLGVLFAGGVLG